MAFRAGLTLRDMEFMTHHPLVIKGTNLYLPTGLINDGAQLHEASGATIETTGKSSIRSPKPSWQPFNLFYARQLGQAESWWGSLFRTVAQRTGVDINAKQSLLHQPSGTPLGDSPSMARRCVVGTWSRWFTGLYAAGDAACTGLHWRRSSSEATVCLMRLSRAHPGRSAAAWVAERKFSTAHSLEAALAEAEADLSTMMEDNEHTHVVRCGTVMTNLQTALASTTTFGERPCKPC